MSAVSWKHEHAVEDGQSVVVMGAMLQLRSVRHLPSFLRWNRDIQKQLAISEGLVRYSLRARFRTLEFDALSIWVDDSTLTSFARSGAHASGARDLQQAGAMASTHFLTWTHTASETWPTWEDLAMRVCLEDVAHAGAPRVRDFG